jgi:hypothetical protein
MPLRDNVALCCSLDFNWTFSVDILSSELRTIPLAPNLPGT